MFSDIVCDPFSQSLDDATIGIKSCPTFCSMVIVAKTESTHRFMQPCPLVRTTTG